MIGAESEGVIVNVLVYGTLTEPEQVEKVLTEYAFHGEWVLCGLHRVEGTYPTLAPGGRVTGRLLSTPEIDRLDRYEGVDRGLYVRVAVPIEGDPGDPEREGDPTQPDGSNAVVVYVGDPTALGVEVEIEWPDEGGFRTRVERYVREHAVSVTRG